MNLSVTFRHMEATDAIRDYAREKLEKIRKYFPDPITAHVVLQAERGYQHLVDVVITLHNGIVLKGREATEDMYSSIDLVMAKIERQVRRYKDRIRDHKPHTGLGVPIRASVLSAESMEPDGLPAQMRAVARGRAGRPEAQPGPPPDQPKSQIIKSSKFFAKPMTVEEAVMQMNLLENEFLVFMNASSRQVNVVYRRKDGNYGLIETQEGVEAEHKAS
ncbi:MAG TPA: ribosome-associated translation inhibitor RaiA [Polyangia bacterium]|nr:ribosome-associated translation inhibitor RaiA [Polyangia bacterium]